MAVHTPGESLECYGMPIVLHKDPDIDQHGNPVYDVDGKQKFRCGFKIGGGIDQDPAQSPHGYPDKGIYITYIYENSPAHNAGLQMHDKLLQVNGHDMTVVTHKKAVDYIRRKNTLNLLVYRKGMPPVQKHLQGAYHPQQPNIVPTENNNFQQQQQFQPAPPNFNQFQPVHEAPGSPHHYPNRQY